MTAIAVVYVVCLASIFGGVLLSREHSINGPLSGVLFFGLFASGLALAVHALVYS